MFYELCVLLIFPFCMIYAGIRDAMSFTIPNAVSLVLVVAFFLLAPFSGLSLEVIGGHILVGFLALIIGFVLFARGYLGGGDVKIIAAAALWLGLEQTAPFLLFTALFGGLLSVSILYIRRMPLPSFLHGQKWLLDWQCGKAAVPYGIAIGLAAICVYPQTHWLGLS